MGYPSWMENLRTPIMLLGLSVVAMTTGCSVVATAIWVLKGKTIPAEFEGLNDTKVVVLCHGITGHEFQPESDIPRKIAKRVGRYLKTNLSEETTIVDHRKVKDYLDQHDEADAQSIGKTLGADHVVEIDVENFYFNHGKTLFNASATLSIEVLDVKTGQTVYESDPISIKFPPSDIHGVPTTDKSEAEFLAGFVKYASTHIAGRFYSRDATQDHAARGFE